MRALLVLLALAAADASAELTAAQLANRVRIERRQWENSSGSAQTASDKANTARERKKDIQQAAQNGKTHDSVGGERCKIDNCIARQERVVKRKENNESDAHKRAKQQAEEYLAAEEAYKAKTGNYLSPGSADEAKTYLEGVSAISSDPPSFTDGGGPSGPGCVDSRGIPCIGDGTTDFESPTGTVDPAAPVVDEDYAPANPGGGGGGGGGGSVPGTGLGDIATGSEGQDLSKYAARGAQTMGNSGGGSARGAFTGGERVALGGGAYSVDMAALRSEIARGAAGNARGAIDAMLKRDPRSPQAHLLDAQARNASGDWEGAEAAARRALELDPQNAGAYKALAVALLHQGKDAEALEAAERAAALDPDDPDAQMLMAFAFEGMGRKDEMMKAVGRAAELDPGRFSSYLNLARMGKRLFDRRRAVKGWHGIPIPAPGSDPGLSAPSSSDGPALTEGSRKGVVVLGGALLLLAALLVAGAVWKKRQDQQAFKLRI